MTKKIDFTFTDSLISWYRENRRNLPWREDKDPYRVWVSEIMLQQTRVAAVREYFLRFMKALPTIRDLAKADEETLLKLWQGLGYYNRVRNLQKAAITVEREFGGQFPETYEEIKDLSGIGEYTAGAIASICFDQQVAAVDGNVLRVMSRILEDYDDVKSLSMKRRIAAYLQALYPEQNCGDFTQSLIELGALICVPKGEPKCDRCPVSDFCKAREANTVLSLPARREKKQRRKVQKTVFILRCHDKIAVSRRGEKVLLAGLYQLPNVDMDMNESDAVAQAERWGCRPQDLQQKTVYKHVFTHVEWEMTGYYLKVAEASSQFQWVTEEDIEEKIALPSAFGYFLKKNYEKS